MKNRTDQDWRASLFLRPPAFLTSHFIVTGISSLSLQFGNQPFSAIQGGILLLESLGFCVLALVSRGFRVRYFHFLQAYGVRKKTLNIEAAEL